MSRLLVIILGAVVAATAAYAVFQLNLTEQQRREDFIGQQEIRYEVLSDLATDKVEMIELLADSEHGDPQQEKELVDEVANSEVKPKEDPLPTKDVIEPPASNSGEKELSVLLASPDSLVESVIDIESIVLVRCEYRTQYFFSSSQPRNEQNFTVGSGIIISGDGHILTVAHVLKQSSEWDDLTDREWSREKCDVARTNKNTKEVSAFKDSEFIPLEITFEPSDEDYNDGFGADFALLKSEELKDFPFVVPAPVLMDFQGGEELIAIGYPGKIVAVPQKLERFDSQMKAISIFPKANCDVSGKPCGIRYFLGRNPNDYLDDLGDQTDLGIITTFFRGGFSGAPVFFKGNLVGIVTHGIDAGATQSGEDEVAALNTFDVAEILRDNDVLDIAL